MSMQNFDQVRTNPISRNGKNAESGRRLSLKANAVIRHWRNKIQNGRLKRSQTMNLPNASGIETDVESQSPKVNVTDKKILPTTLSQPILLAIEPRVDNASNSDDPDSGHTRKVSFVNNAEVVVVGDDENHSEHVVGRSQGRKSVVTPDSTKKPLRVQPKTKKPKTVDYAKDGSSVVRRPRPMSFIKTNTEIRDEDFHQLFKNISSDEQLIIAFPCAWKKDVFIHGRLYLSPNYISFYACFTRWEESFSIRYKDITGVAKEAPLKLMPKTIKIRTSTGQDYECACYSSREKIYTSIFRLWQNISQEPKLDYQQLQSVILNGQDNPDASSVDSEESLSFENSHDIPHQSTNDYRSLPLNLPTQRLSSKSQSSHRAQNRAKLPTKVVKYPKSCTCTSHLAKQFALQTLNYNVDTVFELICGDNQFTQEFHASQRLTNYNHGEWCVNPETGKREREVTYSTVSSSFLGTHKLNCRDNQILDVQKPHLMYVLNREVFNEGVKFADSFYVVTRFCMVQCDAEQSSLRITAEIRYIKNINALAKPLMEKQIYSTIEQGVLEQVRRLTNYRTTANGQRLQPQLILPAPVQSEKRVDNTKSPNTVEDQSSTQSLTSPTLNISVTAKTFTGKGPIHDLVLVFVVLFLFLHLYLWHKLYDIEELISRPEITCWNQCRTTCTNSVNINTDF